MLHLSQRCCSGFHGGGMLDPEESVGLNIRVMNLPCNPWRVFVAFWKLHNFILFFLGYLRKVVTDCDEENKIKNFYIRDRDLSSLESMNLFLHSICITANILFLDHQRWSMMGLLKVYELTHRRIMTFILKLIYVNLYIKHTLDNKNSIHFFFFNLRMVLFSLHHLLIISTSIILNTFFIETFILISSLNILLCENLALWFFLGLLSME